eukprot:151764-Prorocentrum_minimum.AAC.1
MPRGATPGAGSPCRLADPDPQTPSSPCGRRCGARSAVRPKPRLAKQSEARVYSHGGPLGRRKRGYILTADHSDAGSAGIFSRRTNRTQEVRVYSKHVQMLVVKSCDSLVLLFTCRGLSYSSRVVLFTWAKPPASNPWMS